MRHCVMAHIYDSHESGRDVVMDINSTLNSSVHDDDSDECDSVSRVPKAQELFRGRCLCRIAVKII